MRNTRMQNEEDDGWVSDSTMTTSSYSVELLRRRPLSGSTNKRYSKSVARKQRNSVGRKQSLAQYLEKQASFKKNQMPELITTACSRPNDFQKSTKLLSPGSRGSGDNIDCKDRANKINLFHMGVNDVGASSDTRGFPFQSTPSGHYKLMPSQVVYQSKNLGVVAADPTNVSLNITESSRTFKLEQETRSIYDNWPTTCLYTTVGTGGHITFSDFETTSESDRGGERPSELSLAKMGYVTDNCVDWKKFTLPKKSDLKKMLIHNILNMINPDIQIKIGKNVYKCHRIVLQCYSSYFVSKNASQVELPETSVPGEVFSMIYQWMLHTDTDSYKLLRRDNILHIFKAAQYLGIRELEDQCWAFIDNVEIFFEDKAFLMYLEARKLNNKVVMELMVPRVQRFFLTLVSSKEFVEFNCEEVCTFLESNYICIHCEEEVFMAGVRWLRHDWPQRKSNALKIMSCVRFGLINPKLLLSMRRDKSSAEFKPIVNIPEISKMVDDGLSFQILKLCLANDSVENIEKTKQSLNLVDPIPRNWAGTDRSYQSYSEFIRDLSLYRSKQRLEIKKSKIKMQMERVDDDDFLSSAVLPPDTQQKIKRLHKEQSSLMDCIPQLESRELNLFREMIGRDEEDSGKNIKSHLISMAAEKYDPNSNADEKNRFNKTEKHNKKHKYSDPPTTQEQEEAARKIQKAYRTYSSKKVTRIKSSSQLINKDLAARKIQRAYRKFSAEKVKTRNSSGTGVQWKSRSDPSLPSGLTKSSTHPEEKCENDILPLHSGKETVFIFGGSNPFENVDQSGQCIFQYQTDRNCWRKCGEMPEPRHYHCVLFFQGKIYIAGGKHPSKMLSEPGAISRKVWKYDPQYKAWSRIRDMIYARRSFGFVACNDKLFAIGGRNEHDSLMANVEKFDSGSNSWVPVRSMHVARAGAAINEFRGKIWVAGGLTNEENVATNSVEYYNCHHNMWINCTGLRYTLAYAVMVPVNNKLYLVGGAIGLQDSSLTGSGKQIDVWNQECQTWCMAAMMCKPRHAHAAVYVRDTGYMFIMGGMSTRHNCVTDHVECWRVKDEHWILGVAPLPHPVSGTAALALPPNTFG